MVDAPPRKFEISEPVVATSPAKGQPRDKGATAMEADWPFRLVGSASQFSRKVNCKVNSARGGVGIFFVAYLGMLPFAGTAQADGDRTGSTMHPESNLG